MHRVNVSIPVETFTIKFLSEAISGVRWKHRQCRQANTEIKLCLYVAVKSDQTRLSNINPNINVLKPYFC